MPDEQSDTRSVSEEDSIFSGDGEASLAFLDLASPLLSLEMTGVSSSEEQPRFRLFFERRPII